MSIPPRPSFDFYAAFKVLLDHIRKLPQGRSRELAIERLEECAFWTSATMAGQPSPIDYVNPSPLPGKAPKAS